MENYDPNIRNGIHKIKVSLQVWKYKGWIIYDIGGNCMGKNVLDFDFECDGVEATENNCNISYDEDSEVYSLTLTSDDGDTCDFEENAYDMNSMIVGLEILDYFQEG